LSLRLRTRYVKARDSNTPIEEITKSSHCRTSTKYRNVSPGLPRALTRRRCKDPRRKLRQRPPGLGCAMRDQSRQGGNGGREGGLSTAAALTQRLKMCHQPRFTVHYNYMPPGWRSTLPQTHPQVITLLFCHRTKPGAKLKTGTDPIGPCTRQGPDPNRPTYSSKEG